ncbi:MAG: DUF192 domain-containing protein [Bryobacteraceae bacterium]
MCAKTFTPSAPATGLSLEHEVVNLDRDCRIASHVRIAGSSSDRRRGLLGMDCLAAGAGIWITPCEAIHTFGMRMPIDAIFLDSKLHIKKLHAQLGPRRISVCISASSVLELQAGAISRSATQVGDRLTFHPGSKDGE